LYGRTVAALFDHHAPILSLSEPCRDLLICALSGDSDEEAARALHISVAAVKKRWESLFATAGVRLPHLFRENS
jgi:DNA-binding CsgD family transcriptional regulator